MNSELLEELEGDIRRVKEAEDAISFVLAVNDLHHMDRTYLYEFLQKEIDRFLFLIEKALQAINAQLYKFRREFDGYLREGYFCDVTWIYGQLCVVQYQLKELNRKVSRSGSP